MIPENQLFIFGVLQPCKTITDESGECLSFAEEQATIGANSDEWWQLVDLQQNQQGRFPNKVKGRLGLLALSLKRLVSKESKRIDSPKIDTWSSNQRVLSSWHALFWATSSPFFSQALLTF